MSENAVYLEFEGLLDLADMAAVYVKGIRTDDTNSLELGVEFLEHLMKRLVVLTERSELLDDDEAVVIAQALGFDLEDPLTGWDPFDDEPDLSTEEHRTFYALIGDMN